MIELQVVAGPHAGESFVFDSHVVFVVGRSRQAHLRLSRDPFFSRFHFRLEIKPPQCHLVDLESRNGTFVNGERAEQRMLAGGDEIHGGATRIRLEVGAPQAGTTGPVAAEAADDATRDWPGGVVVDGCRRQVSGYELVRELGRGAMGVVYLAIEQTTRRQAAVKLMRSAAAPTTQQLQQFIREANIVSQLSHPRVVGFQEFGMHDGMLYLAMDYVRTVDLRRTLAAQSPAKRVRLSCGIARHVLEALEHAHSRDLVHRDIKPPNILCEKRDGRLFAQLGDFGLAKNFLNAGLTKISQDDEAKGTPAYMSPEQLLNCRYAKPGCDIYSLGACLYEFLCGEPMFAGSPSSRNLIARILNHEIPPLESRTHDVPEELCAVVHRALAEDPARRFASAAHFREALTPFVRRTS